MKNNWSRFNIQISDIARGYLLKMYDFYDTANEITIKLKISKPIVY